MVAGHSSGQRARQSPIVSPRPVVKGAYGWKPPSIPIAGRAGVDPQGGEALAGPSRHLTAEDKPVESAGLPVREVVGEGDAEALAEVVEWLFLPPVEPSEASEDVLE